MIKLCQKGKRTGDLDLIPKLCLVPFHPGLPVVHCRIRQLACVHISLTLKAGKTFSIILWQSRGHGAHIRACRLSGIEPCQPLGSLLLQLLGQLLDRESLDNVLCGGRQQREDGVGAIGLVLFESTSQTMDAVRVSFLSVRTNLSQARVRVRKAIAENKKQRAHTFLERCDHCSCALEPRRSWTARTVQPSSPLPQPQPRSQGFCDCAGTSAWWR